MSLPHSEFIGTETLRGVEFAVERGSSELVGHCWAYDEVSGQVCALVVCGRDWPELRREWNETMDAIIEHLREENGGGEPSLVGLGWDYSNPPPAKLTVA
jgi:hypothetical protein